MTFAHPYLLLLLLLLPDSVSHYQQASIGKGLKRFFANALAFWIVQLQFRTCHATTGHALGELYRR